MLTSSSYVSSKPIFLTSKYQRPAYNPKSGTSIPYQPHRRSASPTTDQERGRRSVHHDGSWSPRENSSSRPKASSSQEHPRARSADRFLDSIRLQPDVSAGQSVAALAQPMIPTQQTLTMLSKSASLQALLNGPPQSENVCAGFSFYAAHILNLLMCHRSIPLSKKRVPSALRDMPQGHIRNCQP